jgi:hypothetical protein
MNYEVLMRNENIFLSFSGLPQGRRSKGIFLPLSPHLIAVIRALIKVYTEICVQINGFKLWAWDGTFSFFFITFYTANGSKRIGGKNL